MASAPGSGVVRPSRPGQRRRLRGLLFLLLATLTMRVSASGAQSPSPSEYQIKAAFLYNFTKFVEWPPQAFANSGSSINLCVLGGELFGDDLEQTIQGKSINGRVLLVQRFKGMQGLEACHVLFVSASEKRLLPQILETLKGRSVLTIGEMEQFATAGGMINFTIEENKVHFEINVEMAERVGLKLSSKLLKLATVIRHGGRN